MNKVNKLATVILVATLSLFSSISEARGIHWGIYLGGNTGGRQYAPPPDSYDDYGYDRGYYPSQRPYYTDGIVHYNPYMGLCKYARGYGPPGYHPCP